MARSKLGGSRSFIQGKVGSDIYQIRRDDSRRMVQVVRSAPEYVQQANTDAQIIARMTMSQIQHTLSQFSEIVNHSFEGVEYGQPSNSRFVQLNYPLLKEDCTDNWEESYRFGWQLKGQETVNCGPWIVSEGSLTLPDESWFVMPHREQNPLVWSLSLPQGSATMRDLRETLGSRSGDFITLFGVAFAPGIRKAKLFLLRHFLSKAFPLDSVITADNVQECFEYDGNCLPAVTFNPQAGVLLSSLIPDDPDFSRYRFGCGGIILSVRKSGVWCRSSCQLEYDEDLRWGVAPNECFVSWKFSQK